jgi:hypothetical protein
VAEVRSSFRTPHVIHVLADETLSQEELATGHPKVAQERLGHSTITTTLDLYSHVTETMQGEAAASFALRQEELSVVVICRTKLAFERNVERPCTM